MADTFFPIVHGPSGTSQVTTRSSKKRTFVTANSVSSQFGSISRWMVGWMFLEANNPAPPVRS